MYQLALKDNVELYPQFVEWYKRTVEDERYSTKIIAFITGRQKNVFGWLTEHQLRPLREFGFFNVHYFPDNMIHSWDLYEQFKLSEIRLSEFVANYDDEMKIYDDRDFVGLLDANLRKSFEFILIEEPEDWDKL